MKIAKEDVSLEDYLTMIGEFAKIRTGVPVNSAFDMGSGVYDITQGDIQKGGLKMLGYTDNKARHITGEKA
ncbi:MAG: hypothetical protein LUG16_08915 [Candidatus Gastranaerophilales bacterium]|nr:hypothetical protein [Candidatus Gastranaerophilales bacterium]